MPQNEATAFEQIRRFICDREAHARAIELDRGAIAALAAGTEATIDGMTVRLDENQHVVLGRPEKILTARQALGLAGWIAKHIGSQGIDT